MKTRFQNIHELVNFIKNLTDKTQFLSLLDICDSRPINVKLICYTKDFGIFESVCKSDNPESLATEIQNEIDVVLCHSDVYFDN